MSISMYAASVPVFQSQLKALGAILSKAEQHAEANKIDPAVLIGARLYPDMFPLLRQVQIATDHAKGAVARLAGDEVPAYADSETSFAELQERIRKTLAFLDGFRPDRIDGSEERDIEIKFPHITLNFKGQHYLLRFALPNFYFHVTTAYDILRHSGVGIKKGDFLGMS